MSQYQKLFQEMNQDLDLVHNVIEVIQNSPQVITPEILKRTSDKLKSVQHRLKETGGKLQTSALPIKKKAVNELMEEYSYSPVVSLLLGILQSYEGKIEFEFNVQNNPRFRVGMSENDFIFIFKAILDSVEKTRVNKGAKRISIQISCSMDKALFSIIDHERFIPEEEVRYFFTGNLRTREYGSGYALYKANKLCEKYNGSLNLFSGRNKCARFQLSVPLI